MSNYTPITNFSSKDALATGNPLKLVKGADLSTEFGAVQTALNSKVDGTTQFFPAGTASQPSVGFQGSAGVGMYNNAGTLSFAAGAALAMSINATGNVVVAAPTSGVALTGTALSGSAGLQSTTNDATFSATGRASIVLSNNSSSAQTPLDWYTAGTLSGRIRNDFQGNMAYVTTASGAHTFYAGGDSGVGAAVVQINSSGLSLSGQPVYSGSPANTIASSYTTVLSDANKTINNNSGSAKNVTIASNATVPYPLSTMITFTNVSGFSSTISINSDTLIFSPSGVTGNRTLANGGVATAIKVQNTTWLISGAGLT